MPSLNKQRTLVLGTLVALHRPMDEAIVENLSNLANLLLTDGSPLMIAGGSEILPVTAVALIIVLLVARIVKRKIFRARGTGTHKRTFGRLFERQRSPDLKPCPNCAEQVPLSALICNACDYNFLAARPGRGQNLLPPPQPMTDEVPEQKNRGPRTLIKPRGSQTLVPESSSTRSRL
jgi:hypothetical protein